MITLIIMKLGHCYYCPLRLLLLIVIVVAWQQQPTNAFHVNNHRNHNVDESCSGCYRTVGTTRSSSTTIRTTIITTPKTTIIMRMRMMMQDRRKSNESSTSHQDGRKKEPSYNYPPSRPNRIVHHNNFVEDDNNNDDKSNILISSSRGGGGVAVVPSVVSLEASQEAAVPTTKVSSSHFYSRKSLQDPSFYHVFAGSEKNNSINNNNNHAIGVSLTQSPPPPPPVFDNLCWAAGIQRPSKIQAISWPTVLKGDHCIIADQTGSGKTYAYLFPLLQRMVYKNDHQPSSSSSSVLSVAAPQLLILAPTSELADQIHMVVSKLLLGIMNQKNRRRRYRATVLTGTGGHATNIRDQIRFLEQQQQQIDILISTPGRIGTILRMRQCQSRILSLERITAVVFDEVDILLLDPSFAPQLETIGQAIQTMSCTAIVNDRTTTTTSPSSSSNSNQNKNVQFVFCTATLPDKVLSTIRGQFPAVELCLGPGLHKIAPTVKDTLIDVSVATTNQNNDLDYKKDGTMIKNDAVLNALRLNRCRRTLIFANTVSSCRAVVNAIQRHDRSSQLYWVDSYHNAMTIPSRQKALQTFIRADDNMDNNNNNNQIHQNNKSYILVATDRAARGVELGIVDHVIIYDFGNSPAEYMRRVGRTARAGRSGSVTVLAYGWQLPIARQLLVSSKSTSNTTTKATTKPGSQDDTKADDDSKNRSRKKKRQSSLSSSSLDEGMFAKDDNGGSDEEEWSFRKKKQQQLRAKPFNYIGESIANGKLWTEREDQNHNNNDR